MINLVVASGKGGTGKTTVAVNLALTLAQDQEDLELLDCDAEEPNCHLFIKPDFDNSWEVGIPVPAINSERCNYCGYCAEVCAFNALAVFTDQVMVLAELCHGCGSCAYFCPEKAISEYERTIGIIESGIANGFRFVHGRLNAGEAMSPPLINAVKKQISFEKTTIIDAPPGTSCPVVSAVSDCDFCLLVTEPTPFGLNDLKLAHQMVNKLGVPAGVVINRSDIGDGKAEVYCRENNLPILQKLPFDREMAELYARSEPAVLHLPNWRRRFRDLYDRVVEAREEVDRL